MPPLQEVGSWSTRMQNAVVLLLNTVRGILVGVSAL